MSTSTETGNTAGTGGAGDSATALADELLEVLFAAAPVTATMVGVPGYDDKLPDPSAASAQEFRARLMGLAQRAEAAQSTVDSAVDAVTLKVVVQQARANVDQLDAHAVEYTISDLYVTPAAYLISMLPLIVMSDADRAADYLTRLRAVPDYLSAVTQRHREGLAAGRPPVAYQVRLAIEHLDRYLADPAHDPLARQPGPADAPTFAADREQVLAELVRPAFARYRDVLAAEFVAPGRPEDRVGLCWLPDGAAMYAGLSRAHTSLDRAPDDLHQVGLDLIDQLAVEFAEIGARVFGSTDRAAIFTRLREDPELRWRDGAELLAAARTAIGRAEVESARWFGRLPSAGCLVEAVPEADAPGSPAAYYMLPSIDGQRPGIYFANTLHAEQRSRHNSEATAFHEAVPGHHFQQAIAMELTELPMLRRYADVNAYAEGWGLYCERLADEMGLYSDDVARLGMLTLDSMRAGRLVVDTGLHAKGWSRAQAVAYLTENTPMPALEISSEVDRYIAYPGQALSYMVGRLEIQRIRAEAERRLGDRFDIKAFHDQVLGGGPLPLSVLDTVIADWAAAS